MGDKKWIIPLICKVNPEILKRASSLSALFEGVGRHFSCQQHDITVLQYCRIKSLWDHHVVTSSVEGSVKPKTNKVANQISISYMLIHSLTDHQLLLVKYRQKAVALSQCWSKQCGDDGGFTRDEWRLQDQPRIIRVW